MGRRKKDYQFVDSASLNNATYRYFRDWLAELAISMFKWEGLPEKDGDKPGVDADFLEYGLFSRGSMIFFEDETLGFMGLNVSLETSYDVYNVPMRRRASAANGYTRELNEENSIVIFNNSIRTAAAPTVDMFARRLYEIQRTMDVNIKAQKTPVLVLCSDSQRLTMQNLYKQYDGNEPFIFGLKSLDLDGVRALKTDAPFIADKLQAAKIQVWNEALSYLGISNVNYEKRERLVKEEVNAAMGGTMASRNSRLKMRKKACEQIKTMYNIDVDVTYNEDLSDIVASATEAVTGDAGNVKIYDRS